MENLVGAAREMQFERAAMIRDEIIALQEQNLETRVLETLSKALKKGKERGLAKKGRQRPPRHPIPKR